MKAIRCALSSDMPSRWWCASNSSNQQQPQLVFSLQTKKKRKFNFPSTKKRLVEIFTIKICFDWRRSGYGRSHSRFGAKSPLVRLASLRVRAKSPLHKAKVALESRRRTRRPGTRSARAGLWYASAAQSGRWRPKGPRSGRRGLPPQA